MSKKMIGVEIGSDSVKLAVCSGGEVNFMAMETLGLEKFNATAISMERA